MKISVNVVMKGGIGSGRHGAYNDGIQIVYICNKNILHIFEGSNREGTSKIGVHRTGIGVGECGEAENILNRTCFLHGKHVVDLVSGGDDVQPSISN